MFNYNLGSYLKSNYDIFYKKIHEIGINNIYLVVELSILSARIESIFFSQ